MTKPLEKRQLRHLERLALETPEPTFQVEFADAIAHELPRLFLKHGEERADGIPVDPDWDAYFFLARAGQLRVTTVRDGDALVGYIFNIVRGHLHAKTCLHCFIDMFWLDPLYRTGWFPVKLFRYNDELLKEWGVKRVFVSVPVQGRLNKIFERLGYVPYETAYAKVF